MVGDPISQDETGQDQPRDRGSGLEGPAEVDVWRQKLEELAPPGMAPRGVPQWTGLMRRNEKKLLRVQAFHGVGVPIGSMLSDSVSITLRSPYEELLKKRFLSLGFLAPAPGQNYANFREYIAYFEGKNRAGVAKQLEHKRLVYVLPHSAPGLAQALTALQLSPPIDSGPDETTSGGMPHLVIVMTALPLDD
ncbi:hypothetical protein GNI_018890 [Gregarina niphandrodes]|uniref:Spen paralogue and orthologue SPOC C-terminal domain-containing protein n=1 Tax=Gregarina niphandrodes TaxID=110365 RepID=A0A023BC47_GRENI|nr:hypothetical protein GNI_018890 [Gregarina niphandrodes]EZG81489.1 hypothetical protein GNI_018890 [Gregarina niphandrodes]|eukprot:XP_011134226.1 hypothetical protein GNI_018890 [Gregarina niphandrodes]